MSRACEWCEDDIPPHILAAFPKAIYCCTSCQKNGNAYGIWGDSRAEKAAGKRLEQFYADSAGQDAPKAKPKTILRRAAT